MKSDPAPVRLTYVGGPTAVIELGGLRLLTDPTFDALGREYRTPAYALQKTLAPALAPEEIGPVDVVLLSHDHHFDNLDHAGRELLTRSRRVLTTRAGAERLGPSVEGLSPWDTVTVPIPDGSVLHVTATPARHGPVGGDRGPVIGFLLSRDADGRDATYVSGDTVWYEGVEEVARRFDVRRALLFMGAARVSAAGPSPLTFTAEEGVEAALAFADAVIVPLHYEGWAHFSEQRADIERAFSAAGLSHRLCWPPAGKSIRLTSTAVACGRPPL